MVSCDTLQKLLFGFVAKSSFHSIRRKNKYKIKTQVCADRPRVRAHPPVCVSAAARGCVAVPQDKRGRFSQEVKLIIHVCYLYNILRIKRTINIYKHLMLYSILLNSLILPFHFIITSQNKEHYQHLLCQIIAFLCFIPSSQKRSTLTEYL